MKKTSLTLSILLLFAGCAVEEEKKVCGFDDSSFTNKTGSPNFLLQFGQMVRDVCEKGDVLSWDLKGLNDMSAGDWGNSQGRRIVTYYCDREKQINVSDDWISGACTYSGKTLSIRY